MKTGTALLLGFVLLATATVVIESQMVSDPLAAFRGPDGRLTIPGRALTEELQRLLFQGNDLRPNYNITFLFPEPSSHPTARLVPFSFDVPNLNVFVHRGPPEGTAGNAIGHRIREGFPPVDWRHVGSDILASVRGGIGWFFDLFTVNARADTVTVDSTTTAVVDPDAVTCTTSQSAAAADNAVLVMLSNRPASAYSTVTYGSVTLSLIAGTASSGAGVVRTEMWFYQGAIPGGAQTMTATLAAGTAKQVCATILLSGVSSASPTVGGTTANGNSANPGISISPGAGELAFAVFAHQSATALSGVTGTGATATDLFGVATAKCTGSGTNLCGAGSDMPNPGTAITWTIGGGNSWVLGAARVVAAPNCGVAAGNCYRIGAGGAWNTGANWSNSAGGASCACTPVASNQAIFNASPSGTITLAAATTIASIDMTGFNGTLDTTGSNWALTINGAFLIQGTFNARNSTVNVTGNVSILTAATVVLLGASTWTINGTWTNQSTAAGWTAGTSNVTIRDAANGTLTFAALAGAANEFSNLTLDASVTTSVTYTMATNALRMSGTLTILNSTGGATGWSVLTTSVANLGITVGGLAVSTFGALIANASAISINGNVNIGAANGYLVMNSSTWTITGTWTNASTSATWGAGTGSVTFNSATGGTMTFAGSNLSGSEFNNITFDSSAASAQTFTMSTRALNWAGTLIVSDGSSTTALATASLGLTGGALNVGNGGILTANASTFTVSSVTMTGGTSGTITLTTGSVTDSGNWDTSGAGSVFTKGTSTVTMSGVSNIAILSAANNFNNLTISAAGTVTQTGLVDVSGTLTVNAGAVLASSTFTLTAATLAANMAGGLTAGAAGTKTINGNVSIAATGFVNFGGATWTFSGSWTNSSTSGSWSAGTGTVVFNSGASRTMTFGNLGFSEFSNVQFSPTAAATFTMATNALRWGGTLTLNNNANLATANLALTGTGGNLTVNNGATLTTGTSTVSVANVTMTGGTSGTITASGTWAVAGNWDTSGAGSTFTGPSSTVTMSGAGTTVKILNSSNGFGVLTISGTVSAASAITTAGFVTVSGTLDTTGTNYGLTIGGGLTVSGPTGVLRTNASTISVTGNVTVNNAAGYITSTAAGSWTASGSWTNSSTSASWSFAAPITFNSAASRTMTFANLTQEFGGNVTFNSGASTVTYTMAANSLDVGGTLTIAGGAGTTTLNTGGLNPAINAVTLNVSAGGSLIANGSTITVRSMDTHLGTFTVGASTIVVNASGGTINISQTVNNLAVNPAISTTFTGSLTWIGTLTFTSAGTIAFGANSLTSSGAATIAFASATITMSSGNWDTSSATTFTATSSTVTFSGTGNVRIGGSTSFGALTVSGGTRTLQSQLTTAGLLTLSGGTLAKGTNALTANAGLTMSGGALTSTSGAVSIPGNVSIAAASYIVFGSESWTVSGSWTDNSTSASWSIGTATVAFNASSSQTMTFAALPGNVAEFYNVTFDSGASTVTFTMTTNALAWSGILTVQGGGGATTLATGNLGLIGGAIAVGNAGVLAANASAVSISGLTMIGGASGTLTLTTGSWAVSGNWNTSGPGSVFSKGTSTVTLTGSGQTVSILNASNGFYNLTVSGTVTQSTAVDVTNSLAVSGTLTTGGFNITGGSNLFVPDGGTLAAGTSTSTFTNVTMTGAVSGTITLTGAWTLGGSWNSTGAGSVLNSGTSTVTFTGTSQTVILASGQMFYNLTIGGTVSINSSVTVASTLTVNNGAVLTKTGQTIAFNTLTQNGTGSIVDGAITVVNFSVTNSDGTNLTAISVFTTWAIDADYTWTHSSTIATSTITFTIGGNTSGHRFNVTKDAVDFTNGLVNGSGQIIFTMLGSDPVVDVRLSSSCGGNRYWIGGAGSWSQTAHWADSSGGVNGCSVPSSSNAVFFDANSGGGTVTINLNAAASSLNSTGWTGTLAIGTFDLAVGGDITHAAGVISIGTSSNAGLTATGTLTLSGSAVLDGSGAASLVTISGDASITSTSAYFRMGTGTWTFGGSWSNGSTSTNWVAGTGLVIFDSSSSQTLTFANLAGDEFHNVTFQSVAGSGTITFSMAANGLRWGGLLVIQDSAGSTTTLVTSNLALTGGSLTVGNSGVLIANASSVAVVDVTMAGGASGTLTLTSGSWTVSGQWDTSGAGSTFARGTSTVTLSGTSASVTTLDATNGFSNLVISGTITQNTAIDVRGTLSVSGTLTTSGNDLTGGANLTISGGGSLVGTSSSIVVSGVTMNDAGTNSISLTTGSISASGTWDTSGASSAFTAGSSTVTLTAASATMALGPAQALASLIIAGNVSLASPLTVSSLTISSGGLAKGPHPLTVNSNLTLAGGYLTSTSGSVSIAGNVSISSASSYIAFGSETWIVSGNWTNASTSASWSAGSAVVTFNATTDQIMTFAGANLAGNEFSTVEFDSGSSTTTFTMAADGLVAQTITLQGGSGTTILTTSGASLPIMANALTVGIGGALTANASILTVRSLSTAAGVFAAGTSTVVVNLSGGSVDVTQTLYDIVVSPGISTTFVSSITWSGALTLTSSTSVFNGSLISNGPAVLNLGASTLSIAGSWDTSSTTTLTSIGSAVTFTSVTGSITLGASQRFATLTIAGTVALATDLSADTLTVTSSNVLTMTNHRIAFNSLTVSGTITDGSVNVTDLTVTNSDTTASVTIAGFSEWSRGSSYAWTHTSSDSSQTITWTIGGNAATIPYAVTKDGSSFATGTVNSSGQVIFTMLGSDPAMQVTVHNPIPPPWWQSSYLLAIFPIGILLGVAMFAQRQRWRPAKAFLVDYSGRMLREFTLDPACQVTYDQAVQAGILDAVDKPIKVTKYHGQTVRGDALAVVLLAYGPVTREHVEFAREMLVQIQDKFEDGVKQRLEEARAQEANVATQMNDLATRRTEVETRAAEAQTMAQQSEAVQAKIIADTDAVEAKEQDLRRREEELANNRRAIDELARQTEEDRNSIDRRTGDLQGRAAEIAAKSEAVEAREEAVSALERTLRDRDETLATGEAGLQEIRERLATDTSAVQARLDEAGRREEALGRDQANLSNAREKFQAEQRELLEFKRSIDSRVSAVEEKETE